VCDPRQHLFRLTRAATRRAFRAVDQQKTGSTEAWLGCSAATLQAFIRHKMDRWNSQYLEKMHAGNIEIDHIKPISAARSAEDLHALAHYTNLQPLLKSDNASKSARWSASDDATWRRLVLYQSARVDVFWPECCPALPALGVEWGALDMLARVSCQAPRADMDRRKAGGMATRFTI